MKIQEAYALFLTHGRAERQYAAETLTKLKDCFSAWILPKLGECDLEALSRLDILRFRSVLVDANLGINRIYSVLMALKLFLKFCRQILKLACLDPDTEVKLPQRPKPHVYYLTNEEVQRVLDVINTNTFTGMRMRVLVDVLVNCPETPTLQFVRQDCVVHRFQQTRSERGVNAESGVHDLLSDGVFGHTGILYFHAKSPSRQAGGQAKTVATTFAYA